MFSDEIVPKRSVFKVFQLTSRVTVGTKKPWKLVESFYFLSKLLKKTNFRTYRYNLRTETTSEEIVAFYKKKTLEKNVYSR